MKRKLNNHWNEYTIADSSGKSTLRYLTYYKGSGTPRACLVFANGRTEWAEKYSHLTDALKIPDDCMFLTMDHSGQGASGGSRAWIDHYHTYAADLSTVIQHAIDPSVKYSVVAHSMGGLISLYASLQKLIEPQALVLCSPLLRLSNYPLDRRLLKPLAWIATNTGLSHTKTGAGKHQKNKFNKNKLTSSYESFELINNPPYRVPSATIGWVEQTLKATQAVFDIELLEQLKSPTLVLGGSLEKVVDAKAFSEWAQLAHEITDQSIQLKMVIGAKHELLMELPIHKDVAVASIIEWLQEHSSIYQS